MPIKDPEKRREYHRQYMATYLEDPVKRKRHLDRVARNNRKSKAQCRALLHEFKRLGCVKCGTLHQACLVAHHRDPAKKDFSLGSGFSRVSPERVRRELAKCVCLCMNCHARLHAGDLDFEGS